MNIEKFLYFFMTKFSIVLQLGLIITLYLRSPTVAVIFHCNGYPLPLQRSSTATGIHCDAMAVYCNGHPLRRPGYLPQWWWDNGHPLRRSFTATVIHWRSSTATVRLSTATVIHCDGITVIQLQRPSTATAIHCNSQVIYYNALSFTTTVQRVGTGQRTGRTWKVIEGHGNWYDGMFGLSDHLSSCMAWRMAPNF